MQTLTKFAQATNAQIQIVFKPIRVNTQRIATA